MSPSVALQAVKFVHTLAWAFFAGCIAINGWRCPLTDVAARYTADRRDNFDIFLPELLARHDKLIFGSLFVAATVYTLIAWAAQ